MNWHYQNPRTGERNGPTSQEVLADKLRQGELDGGTLVWRDGLAQWTPAARTDEFAADCARAVPTVAPASAAATIGYFAPRTDTPARVRENLRKYATPTGPVGEWPLNDAHVEQLSRAVSLRKKILGAYNLARLLAFLYAIATVIVLIVGLASLAGNARSATYAWPMLVAAGFVGALCVLFFACARATWYCRAWGALVMAILSTIGCVLQLAAFALSVFAATTSRGDAGAAALGNIVGLLFAAAFAFVYWRGWRATAPYLDTPVWCQEALAVSERTK